MDQRDLHYETPLWAEPVAVRPRVPQQADPVHETAPPRAETTPRTIPDPGLPTTGEWHEVMPRRRARGVVLGLSVIGCAAGLAVGVVSRSPYAFALAFVCAVAATLTRTALIRSTPTVVRLKGSTLEVRRNGRTDDFALADPNRRIETSGLPGRPDWRLRLEAHDLHTVELSAEHVDADLLHQVVAHHRAVAAEERRAHDARFRR